jgi:hypothetical protein
LISQSRGLGDVYKRQSTGFPPETPDDLTGM